MNISIEAKDPSGVEKYLQYEFSNKDLLHEALRHSSYVNEMAPENLQDNERLEFLGDAVLNLIVGHILMRRYPEVNKFVKDIVKTSGLKGVATIKSQIITGVSPDPYNLPRICVYDDVLNFYRVLCKNYARYIYLKLH